MIGRILLAAYAVVGVVNVVAETAGLSGAAHLTKPMLMPLLLAWLVVVMRPAGGLGAALRGLAAGVAFAWLGDLLLMGDGDAFFTGGIAAFLVTQVCYIVAFTRIPGPGLVRAWRIALVPYAVIWIVLNLLVSPGVGDMRVPVLLYSVVLISMSVAALDLVIRVPQRLGWRIAAGALLFVASDAVIALTAFGPLSSSPALTGLIMATYVAAQALIVTGMAGSVLALRSAATR